jgi:hypothetical protein
MQINQVPSRFKPTLNLMHPFSRVSPNHQPARLPSSSALAQATHADTGTLILPSESTSLLSYFPPLFLPVLRIAPSTHSPHATYLVRTRYGVALPLADTAGPRATAHVPTRADFESRAAWSTEAPTVVPGRGVLAHAESAGKTPSAASRRVTQARRRVQSLRTSLAVCLRGTSRRRKTAPTALASSVRPFIPPR